MPQAIPQPGLLEPLTLHPPRLPADLAGFRILHISDLHIREPAKRLARLLAQLHSPAFPGCDLLLITGDVIHGPGHEAAGVQFLHQLLDAAHPRHGCFGCFGNHDSAEFRKLARSLPITWLVDSACHLPQLPVNLLGLQCSRNNPHGDLLASLLHESLHCPPDPHRLRILLSHLPTWLIPAADAGIDLLFAGHTHGGQVRMPGRRTLYNSCPDWPLHHSSGVVQQGRTLGIISRGLGESNVPGLRLFCKPHAPLLTLNPPEPTHLDRATHEPTLIVPW